MQELKFTATEKQIYEEMLKTVKMNKKETVAVIADAAGVVPSSVVKLAKKLGYKGWNEMYYTLRSTYTDVISLSFDRFDLFNDQQTRHYVDILSEMLYRYHDSCIFVSSIGDGQYAGDYLTNHLWKRGFIVMPYARHTMEAMGENHKAGIVFIINESGVVLVHNCIEAKEKNYNIVSITGNAKSPLASNSHVAIEMKHQKSSLEEYSPNFFTAYVISFIELLFVSYDHLLDIKQKGRK